MKMLKLKIKSFRMKDFKVKLYNECIQAISEKIQSIKIALESLRDDIQSESKSSSGDKHETGRAMIHLEQEQLSSQLLKLNDQFNTLKRIEPLANPKLISAGSLVETNDFFYFISIPLGKIIIDKIPVYCISLNSPLGLSLSGKRNKESYTLNNKTILILNIH